MNGAEETFLIDAFDNPEAATCGQRWQFYSDTVMGGVSTGSAEHERTDGRQALRLRGEVSLKNNGGFVQTALDLTDKDFVDASDATGVAVTLRGDGRSYAINLRTVDTQRPWQSYRCSVATCDKWTTVHLPFADFEGRRIEQPLNTRRLRRIGLIAIGEPGTVDVAMSRIALYRETP